MPCCRRRTRGPGPAKPGTGRKPTGCGPRSRRAGWRIVDRGTDFALTPAAPPDVADGDQIRYGSSRSVPSQAGRAGRRPRDGDPPRDGLARRSGPHADRSAGIPRRPAPRWWSSPTGHHREQEAALGGASRPPEARRPATSRSRSSGRASASATRPPPTPGCAGRPVRSWSCSTRASNRPATSSRPSFAALDDPTVAVTGAWGIVSRDLRRFEDAPPGDVDAIEGYCLAFRRADFAARGPLDEHFRFYRNLDIWWSLVLRDGGESGHARRACSLDDGLPLVRHEHRGYASLPRSGARAPEQAQLLSDPRSLQGSTRPADPAGLSAAGSAASGPPNGRPVRAVDDLPAQAGKLRRGWRRSARSRDRRGRPPARPAGSSPHRAARRRTARPRRGGGRGRERGRRRGPASGARRRSASTAGSRAPAPARSACRGRRRSPPRTGRGRRRPPATAAPRVRRLDRAARTRRRHRGPRVPTPRRLGRSPALPATSGGGAAHGTSRRARGRAPGAVPAARPAPPPPRRAIDPSSRACAHSAT